MVLKKYFLYLTGHSATFLSISISLSLNSVVPGISSNISGCSFLLRNHKLHQKVEKSRSIFHKPGYFCQSIPVFVSDGDIYPPNKLLQNLKFVILQRP